MRFFDRLDAWVEQEAVTTDLQLIVLPWIMSRTEDPYQGVQRTQGFDNLWFGPVPNSEDGRGHVVTCSYWIEESKRRVFELGRVAAEIAGEFETRGEPLKAIAQFIVERSH